MSRHSVTKTDTFYDYGPQVCSATVTVVWDDEAAPMHVAHSIVKAGSAALARVLETTREAEAPAVAPQLELFAIDRDESDTPIGYILSAEQYDRLARNE